MRSMKNRVFVLSEKMTMKPKAIVLVASLVVIQAGLAQRTVSPLLKQLPRFSAPGVPAMGPGETEVAPLPPAVPIPTGLPGHGLAEHSMLYIGEGYNKMLLVDHGK